jgi:hypothetical protein
MASSQYPHSTSSSVTLTEGVSNQPIDPNKVQDASKPQDLEANQSDTLTEAESTADKAPLSSIRKHVLLALFAMVSGSHESRAVKLVTDNAGYFCRYLQHLRSENGSSSNHP